MTTKVTEKPKKIKPLLNFGKLADPEFIQRLEAINSGVYGHPQVFSTPPVDAATFKAGIDTYNTLTTDALEHSLSEEDGRRIGSPQFESAARALLAMSPEEATALELLKHRRSDVRGRAILECLKRIDEPWARRALETAAPHALAYR